MCTVTRICTLNQNTGISKNGGRLLQDTNNVYIFWTEVNTAVRNNTAHNSVVKVRSLAKSTLTLGAVSTVDSNNVVGGEEAWDWDSVATCRLTSGVMIAAYGTGYLGTGPSVHAKESAVNDHTTWGARSTPVPAGAGYCVGGLVTDGTNVTLLIQDNFTADIYAYKRTAANTWVAHTTALGSGKIVDSNTFGSGTPWYDIFPSMRLTDMTEGVMVSSLVMGFLLPYASTTTARDQMRWLYTTDAWATTKSSIVKNYVGSPDNIATGTSPRVQMGADGRLRASWVETNAALGKDVPCLAYSNDGATWTVIGTPVSFGGKNWDVTYDGAFCLDSDDRMYLSMFDATDASNIKHYMYKGGDSLSGWVETICSHIETSLTVINVSGALQAAMFVADNGDLVRIFGGVVFDAVAPYNIVAYLLEEGVTDTPGGAPPLVEESPSGSDAANVYIRNKLAIEKGWSAHDLGVSCWAEWGEGDYTTQRRLPILLAGASTIDPSVSDPSTIPAIWKVDDPERYDREVWAYDASGNLVVRGDPFTFEWRSKAFPLVDRSSLKWSIARGFLISYRALSDLTIETWVDGRISQTDTLPATGPDLEGRDLAALSDPLFFPIATDDNLGTLCQLRITDETPYPLAIEAVGIMRIEKGVRG